MTDNITVAMVLAARDLVQQTIAQEQRSRNTEQDAETTARVFKTIYRAIAESVYHSGAPRK